MASTGLDWAVVLPRINASFNLLSVAFLTLGFLAIRRRQIARHRAMMLSALGSSALFLVGYLTRVAYFGTHRFPDIGWPKTAYLALLFSHMVLAVVMVPMILRAVYLAWRSRFEAHRRLAAWTWPIWMYVSITGVGVYAALYHLAPWLTP